MHVERHEQLDSTNNRAALLAAQVDAPLPTLIVAEQQTAGRGRGANRWWSSAGALTFSLLINATEEQLPAARWPLVSLAAALAVGEVLTGALPQVDVRLKWPNDVFANGRKICGILVEAPAVRPARLIVGVGLNVNNSLATAPPEIRIRATAMCDEAQRSFAADDILDAVVHEFLGSLAPLASGQLPIVERWQPQCLLAGRMVSIDVNGREVRGRCLGIDAQGGLRVATVRGEELLFAGVVTYWE